MHQWGIHLNAQSPTNLEQGRWHTLLTHAISQHDFWHLVRVLVDTRLLFRLQTTQLFNMATLYFFAPQLGYYIGAKGVCVVLHGVNHQHALTAAGAVWDWRSGGWAGT